MAAVSELDRALKLFCFLLHQILYIIQEKQLELSSVWISWTALRACVWLSGGWIVFLRDKEQGKNVESICQKLVVGTWVGGGIATASSLSQRVVPVDSLGVCRAEHVSGKGCDPVCLPWHSGAWRGLKWWVLPLYWGRGGKTCKTLYLDFIFLLISRQTALWAGSSVNQSLMKVVCFQLGYIKMLQCANCAGSGCFCVRA